MVETRLRVSSPQKEGVLSVSKALKVQVLLSQEEMAALCKHLTPFYIYIVSEAVGASTGWVPLEEFLSCYARYVEALKRGELPDERECRPYFSSVFTADPDTLYAMQVGEGKHLVKPIRPIIQLQLHRFSYSALDQKFHPMALSQDSITWGVQFSYPQICQDPMTRTFSKVSDVPSFPNTSLFSKLSKWLRAHTLPTPMIVEQARTNLSIRLGKACFDWINMHPQLVVKNFRVDALCQRTS